MSLENLKTAVYGTAAKINKEFAKACNGFRAQGIDLVAGFETQIRALNNFNTTLHDKKELDKSSAIDLENNKKLRR